MITPRRAAAVLIRTGCALIALGLISACSAPTPTPPATATATHFRTWTPTFMVSLNTPGLTHDGGETWHFPRVEPCTAFETISGGVFFDDQHGYVVGTGGVARTSDGGNTWECLLYPERGE